MDSLTQIPGVGTQTLAKLNKLNIFKPIDLLYHFPYRYIDFSHITNIISATENESITITGQLISFQNIFTRSHKTFKKPLLPTKLAR